MEITISGVTGGYLAFGVAHGEKHATDVEYDAFIGGVKDGEAYGATYAVADGRATKLPEVRYVVSEDLRSSAPVSKFNFNTGFLG